MSNNDDRNLIDVFNELQQKRADDIHSYGQDNYANSNGITTYFSSNRKRKTFYDYKKGPKQAKVKTKRMSYTKLSIGLISTLFFVSVALLYISYSFANNNEETIASVDSTITNFESNNNKLNLTQIISSNVDVSTIKENVKEEREVNFSIKYQSVDNLPKGEEQIIQPGVNGKSKVEAVRTYSNNEMVEENIINTTAIVEPVEQIVNIGTSQFLKDFEVHLGDIMYVTENTSLLDTASSKGNELVEIPATLDVKLLELADEYCKVSYDDKTGYVLKDSLTSAAVAPEMVNKARIQRILRDVKLDMPLNKKSGLADTDYKEMLSNNVSDKNKIFENNYKDFYEVEQKYNINGVFLAALAIHESGWGTSQIANDKKNLFGYGAHDSDPYNGAYEFKDYKEGLELVAKVLVKTYINPSGTEIFNNEKATATYYNGSTLAGVNKKYSTDPDWHQKVFNYMEMLYNKLTKI